MATASARALQERTTSAFDLSIGTSLALESLFQGPKPTYDAEREKPPHIPIDDYEELWVNVSTLYRNIVQAIPAGSAASIMPGDVLDTLITEMELIKDMVNQFTSRRVPVVFYRSHYAGMAQAHPHAKRRIPNTPKQIAFQADQDQVLNQLFKAHTLDLGLKDFARALKPDHPRKVLVMTHYAYDLLSAGAFTDLHLLESHTGLLKKRPSFYTKLTKPSHGDLVRIPFNVVTLQVFGDSQTFFAQPAAVRQQVLEMAQANQWTALTTTDRLRLNFSLMKDRFTGEILKQMLAESV